MHYGISKTVNLSFEQAVEKVTSELQKEGFGVLTQIDVKDTLKKKLDVEFTKYSILGACNPPFAHSLLEIDKEIGLFLPCNVLVYEKGGNTVVSAFNPMSIMPVVGDDRVVPVAEEVTRRLQRVVAAL